MLESWFFYAILSKYQKWFPENFVKICSILTLKISFEKFRKNKDFRKSPKKFGQNGWREISFFLQFLNSWVPRKRGKVRHSQKYEKKSENHCTPLYMSYKCTVGNVQHQIGKVKENIWLKKEKVEQDDTKCHPKFFLNFHGLLENPSALGMHQRAKGSRDGG